MRCFYHLEQHAVGLCKSCGKALCHECAVDMGKGLACKGQCETAVEKLINLIDRSLQQSPISDNVLKNLRKNTFVQGGFLLVAGLIFFVMSLLIHKGGGWSALLGMAFIIYGVFILRRAIAIPK